MLKAIDAAEYTAKQVPFLICAGITCLSLIGIQKMINRRVIYECPLNISTLMVYPTVLGDSYACISRNAVMGPPMPLKD